MPDWIGHFISSAIEGGAAIIVLYVSYRIASLKNWLRAEIERIIKENCVSQISFSAHVESDETFQENITGMIEKNEVSAGKVLEAKFETVKIQVASVGDRVSHLSKLIERRLN